MAKPKSVRPGPPAQVAGPVQRAAKLLGTLGRSGAGELDAFLEGVNEDEILGAAAHLAPLDLANVALAVFLTAHDLTQSVSREQRARLRGCTPQLVALALEQAVTLHNVASERAERNRGRDVARKELATLCPAVEMQCAHARSLLMKVAPDQVSARLAAAARSPSDLTYELETLATVARELLGGGFANIATRARLYGVDNDFVDDIERLAGEHRALQRRAIDVGLPPAQAAAARRAHMATWILAKHVTDTFAAARSLDRAIPPLPLIPRPPARKPQPASSTTMKAPLAVFGAPQPATGPNPPPATSATIAKLPATLVAPHSATWSTARAPGSPPSAAPAAPGHPTPAPHLIPRERGR